MASVDAATNPMAKAASVMDEAPLESIWDCAKMKKIVDPIANKEKMKHLHCGMVAAYSSTKLAYHFEKKIEGDIRECVADHSSYCTKLRNDSLNKSMAAAAARKSCVRKK